MLLAIVRVAGQTVGIACKTHKGVCIERAANKILYDIPIDREASDMEWGESPAGGFSFENTLGGIRIDAQHFTDFDLSEDKKVVAAVVEERPRFGMTKTQSIHPVSNGPTALVDSTRIALYLRARDVSALGHVAGLHERVREFRRLLGPDESVWKAAISTESHPSASEIEGALSLSDDQLLRFLNDNGGDEKRAIVVICRVCE